MKPTFGLGTVGVRDGTFYADVFLRPYFGLFVNDGITRRWYKLPSLRLLKVEVLDLEQARRIARRTMRPYNWVTLVSGDLYMCVCFPFIENGRVMVNLVKETGGAIRTTPVHLIRPWKFAPFMTGVPADDPVMPS